VFPVDKAKCSAGRQTLAAAERDITRAEEYYGQDLPELPIQPPRHVSSSFLGAVGDEHAATT
jgi:hypothetical protein